MLGTIVNTCAVIIGSSIGMLFHRGIPEKITAQMMKALGLSTIFIGIQGAFKSDNTLMLILSMVGGVIIGEAIDIDYRVTKAVNKLEKRLMPTTESGHLSQGLLSASLLFCVGSMTIVGCLNAGILHDYTLLFTKSVMDFCASMIFASTMGIGVLLSSVVVLLYQGALTLLAGFAEPFLTTAVINEMTCVGSLVIVATGLNVLEITQLKLMNYIPAMFLPIILSLFM